MKKKILGGLAVLAIVALAICNVNFSSKIDGMMSDVMLANVEALAQAEYEGNCNWKTQEAACGCGWWALCDSDGVGYTCKCGESKWYPN